MLCPHAVEGTATSIVVTAKHRLRLMKRRPPRDTSKLAEAVDLGVSEVFPVGTKIARRGRTCPWRIREFGQNQGHRAPFYIVPYGLRPAETHESLPSNPLPFDTGTATFEGLWNQQLARNHLIKDILVVSQDAGDSNPLARSEKHLEQS